MKSDIHISSRANYYKRPRLIRAKILRLLERWYSVMIHNNTSWVWSDDQLACTYSICQLPYPYVMHHMLVKIIYVLVYNTAKQNHICWLILVNYIQEILEMLAMAVYMYYIYIYMPRWHAMLWYLYMWVQCGMIYKQHVVLEPNLWSLFLRSAAKTIAQSSWWPTYVH